MLGRGKKTSQKGIFVDEFVMPKVKFQEPHLEAKDLSKFT